MKEEDIQKLKDNISEYGDDEYYESETKVTTVRSLNPCRVLKTENNRTIVRHYIINREYSY